MTRERFVSFLTLCLTLCLAHVGLAQESVSPKYPSISGIYPHLAYWNDHGECGTGAVVPWAGKLWVITYAPHMPKGSTDKLYSISPNLDMQIHEESVGGTPANRLIHQETNQLVIGPYVIDAEGAVRVIPPTKMPGRLTGTARHLSDPENKVYFATMEEGIYEVDLNTLDVTELFQDDQSHGRKVGDDPTAHKIPFAALPGYHGKGLYSGQGRLIYANNGEASKLAQTRPDIPSGCLAEWDGKSNKWKVIRRNQFTDIRGPGDLTGNSNPETDPIWAIGWDHRSLILMLLDQGEWYTYRLPKASHCYDGAHGWNTEWPRIHDIGETDLVMNMHGMFWHFPRTFSRDNSAGILPRSTYLKVIGDYCLWNDQLVFGCDDAAHSEFLNTRKAKGKVAGPGQSHSNLWFTSTDILDHLGASLGRGGVWQADDVAANAPSDPYLFAGFQRRSLCLSHGEDTAVDFLLEVDARGNNQWEELTTITVPAGETIWHDFAPEEKGVWLRISTKQSCQEATAQFQFANPDVRKPDSSQVFNGLRDDQSENYSEGVVRVRGDRLQTMAFAATQYEGGKPVHQAFYELDGDLKLTNSQDMPAFQWTQENAPMAKDVLTYDEASILYVDDEGNRWRLPRNPEAAAENDKFGPVRIAREVATERDLFNCGGIFYELPARNADGIAKVRPVCSHPFAIHDFCSYRGLMILTGVNADASGDHIIRSEDGRVSLWAGVIDDLWKLGKPVGVGGPWKNSPVKAGVPSDPFLMTGFEQKSLTLTAEQATDIRVEVDIDGTGNWHTYETFSITPGNAVTHPFPESFQAYWVRLVSSADATASGQLTYK
ncbi:hypothetical protein ACYFX5_01085 [Bremerella sp. T1]|uniref:hypothetical protein n=1 Tax=Bremerella sp. TYQ1 TaxID=3119568 RepID=UPI001CCF9B91|nr:hypothetical protein [Bremerella volcania]UBM36883.1 hypothetical protein LA756_03045 [Bremerella volcania]